MEIGITFLVDVEETAVSLLASEEEVLAVTAEGAEMVTPSLASALPENPFCREAPRLPSNGPNGKVEVGAVKAGLALGA